jgi:hypothetical protein
MRTLSVRHCVLAYLALVSLLLSLSLQIPGGTGMDMPLPVGQTSMMEMSAPCDGCDETSALAADCVSIHWSCAQMPSVAVASNGLTAFKPAAEQLAIISSFHRGLSPAPEPQPPRGLCHAYKAG